jgi:hypothetical protein
LKAGLAGQMGQIFEVAGGEIVDAENGVALAQQAIGEVRAEKSGGAGNKYVHRWVHFQAENWLRIGGSHGKRNDLGP